jgi:hypothetical protein
MDEPDPIGVALRDLVQSDGWRIFKAAISDQWGAVGYGREMQRAVSSIPHGPDRAYELARVAEQVEAMAQAVNQIMAWPMEELKRRAAPAPATRPFDRLRRLTR